MKASRQTIKKITPMSFDRIRGSSQTLFRQVIVFRWGIRGCAVFCNKSWVSLLPHWNSFIGDQMTAACEKLPGPFLSLAVLPSPWLGCSYGSALSIACCLLLFHRITDLKDSSKAFDHTHKFFFLLKFPNQLKENREKEDNGKCLSKS